MAAFILTDGATIMCPHSGTVNITTSNTQVKADGQAIVTMSDTFTISGCPFQIPVGAGTKPQPCVTLKWIVPAKRVKVNGQLVLLQDSSGICQSAEQIPQGPPNVVMTQMRAKGT